MILMSLDGSKVIASVAGLKEGTPRAIMRALNRAIASARTVMTRAVAADTGLKQADIRDKMTLRNATVGNLTASFSAPLKRIPLMDFKAVDTAINKGSGRRKRTGRGVTYKLPTGKGVVPNAFIATTGSGHTAVFARVGAGRLPIRDRIPRGCS